MSGFDPITVLTGDGAPRDVNFFIPFRSLVLFIPPNICLELEAAIKFRMPNANWKFITDAEGVTPAKNFIHSLFLAVHLGVADRMLSNASSFYSYRAYMESLLPYTMNAQKSQLTSNLFIKDT